MPGMRHLTAPGQAHLPHQQTFLAWALAKEQSVYGGGICADACGMGKTHEIISLILAGRQFWTLQGRKCQPTLVVCPNSLQEKWYDDLFDMCGVDFEILLFKKIELNKLSAVFQRRDPSTVIVLATYEQLGLAKTIDDSQRGLFDRIILDEAHAIRRLEATKRGRVLATLGAEFRWSFSATIIYNSLEDISGFLAFHQRVEWAADNGAADERLMEFVNGLFEQSGVSDDDAMSIAPNDSEMLPDNVTDNNDAMSVALNDAEMSPDNVAGFVTELEHLDNRSDSHA
ncbi:MAG: hypothetical protein M1839_000546 [Geoglossum umbratile]|nr:MAG: hypothetical protein M1839_000546 [Geoglossum umbratile]